MPTLLDVIRGRKLADGTTLTDGPLVVDADEWAWFLETGECPWVEITPGIYRHEHTGEVYVWGAPFVLPGEH